MVKTSFVQNSFFCKLILLKVNSLRIHSVRIHSLQIHSLRIHSLHSFSSYLIFFIVHSLRSSFLTNFIDTTFKEWRGERFYWFERQPLFSMVILVHSVLFRSSEWTVDSRNWRRTVSVAGSAWNEDLVLVLVPVKLRKNNNLTQQVTLTLFRPRKPT